jgi:hypothetical protein
VRAFKAASCLLFYCSGVELRNPSQEPELAAIGWWLGAGTFLRGERSAVRLYADVLAANVRVYRP